jgi:hypothetical protein
MFNRSTVLIDSDLPFQETNFTWSGSMCPRLTRQLASVQYSQSAQIMTKHGHKSSRQGRFSPFLDNVYLAGFLGLFKFDMRVSTFLGCIQMRTCIQERYLECSRSH